MKITKSGKITFTNSGNSTIIDPKVGRLNGNAGTTLRSLKMMEIKPNYSSLSREFGMDRHTIKKMYERMDAPPRGRWG